MKIFWRRPGFIGLAFKLTIDENSADIAIGIMPFFHLEIDVFHHKNYYCKRGIYPFLEIFGLNIEPNDTAFNTGEKTYEDEEVT